MAKKQPQEAAESLKDNSPALGQMDALAAKRSNKQNARVAEYCARMAKGKPPKFKPSGRKDIPLELVVEGDDWLLASTVLAEAFGTADDDLRSHLLAQAVRTVGYGQSGSPENCNFVTAALHGIRPRDELEGLLAVQMIGTHNLAMACLQRAALKEQTFEGVESNVNRATKLMRTFVAQMEALQRYRGKGQQRVVVEHVHVNKGGQAIVGTVQQGSRGEGDGGKS